VPECGRDNTVFGYELEDDLPVDWVIFDEEERRFQLKGDSREELDLEEVTHVEVKVNIRYDG
jgi:hypothetical protein